MDKSKKQTPSQKLDGRFVAPPHVANRPRNAPATPDDPQAPENTDSYLNWLNGEQFSLEDPPAQQADTSGRDPYNSPAKSPPRIDRQD